MQVIIITYEKDLLCVRVFYRFCFFFFFIFFMAGKDNELFKYKMVLWKEVGTELNIEDRSSIDKGIILTLNIKVAIEKTKLIMSFVEMIVFKNFSF